MAAVNTYKVTYHFELAGKANTAEYVDYVQATASDYTTIKAVLSSNSKLRVGTLVLSSVQEVGHGDNVLA